MGVGADATDDQPLGVYPWAQDELGGASTKPLGDLKVDFEAIAALRPDLITGLSSGLTEEEYGLLSEIAPTIAQPGDHPDYFAPWQVLTRTAGAALGAPERAEQLVAGVTGRFAQARAEHPEFAGAEAVYAGVLDGSGFYVETTASSRAAILTDLGFAVPTEFTELAGDLVTYAEISAEQLTLLDRDVIVWESVRFESLRPRPSSPGTS